MRKFRGKFVPIFFISCLVAFSWLCTPLTAASSTPDKGSRQTVPQNIRIIVHPLDNTLSVWEGRRLIKLYRIAMGTEATPSPVGDWTVSTKAKNWGKGFGTRWIGLNVPWGIYGIHGTNKPSSIGSKASHGCIRMHNQDVEELYEWVKIGTPVSIVGHPLGDPGNGPRVLVEGDIGSDVMLVQSRLRSAGFYQGAINGKFGTLTQDAVKQFETANGLGINGDITLEDYLALGLVE